MGLCKSSLLGRDGTLLKLASKRWDFVEDAC